MDVHHQVVAVSDAADCIGDGGCKRNGNCEGFNFSDFHAGNYQGTIWKTVRFFHRTNELLPRTVVLFPGSFHPPTVAHVELARRALLFADEIVFVLPEVFPHKTYDGVSAWERMVLLSGAIDGEDRFSVAQSDGGLFIEMAREFRELVDHGPRVMLLCGRDAAERIVGWDYGVGAGLAEQLQEYELLVAARSGDFETPMGYRTRIHALPLVSDMGHISASEVRRRIESGEEWKPLVPEAIREQVRLLYSR